MNTLLFQIYRSSASKYIKFRKRLDKNISSGKFRQFTRKKQGQLLSKIERLRKRVLQLQTQLRLAGAGVAISLFLNSSPAEAQTTVGPFVRNYIGNPLPPPLPYLENAAPAYVDLDGDGDLDLVVGDRNSHKLYYFKNVGSKSKPRFLNIKSGDSQYPFSGILSPAVPLSKMLWVPAFADIDSDGDYDLLIGTHENAKYGTTYGTTYFFKNVGDKNTAVFENQTGSANPFEDVYSIENANPAFADIDNDGDVDLILGGYYLTSGYNHLVQYFKNEKVNPTDKNEPPNFVKQGSGHAFSVNNNLDDLAPSGAFADIDKDGDLDFFYSNNYGILYRRNDGGVFNEQSGPWIPNSVNPGNSSGNPFDQINLVLPNNFTFADLDDDGDLDATMAYYFEGSSSEARPFLYYENKGQGVFEFIEGIKSPVDGVDVLNDSNASLADLDGDGDLDILAFGSYYDFDPCNDGCEPITIPSISIFRNNQGTFEDVTLDEKGKFAGIVFAGGGNSAKLLYVDDDNVPDLVVPYFTSPNLARVRYFKLINGTYQELTGTNNPFDNIQLTGPAFYINLDIGDINNDGLPDLILGTNNSTPTTWRNTGTKQNPLFTREVSWEGGFVTSQVIPKPKFLDVDNDGDLDIVVGKYDGMWYYENTGTPSSPSFVERNGASNSNPFKGLNSGTFPQYAPNFNDFDGDGDQDLLAGDVNGQFQYFENTNPAPVTTLAATLNFSQQSTPIILDASLTLSDIDGDFISSAIISIANFRVGQEVLSFTPQAGITGSFNSTTGMLTLKGRASISDYTSALRTVSYQYTGPTPTSSGRLASGNSSAAITLSRSITMQVLDQDFTNPLAKVMALEISFQDPVPGAIEVFNGISPNSDGLNDFFEVRNIAALEPNNKVSIYTRWGDKVFEIENYDNDQRKFTGLNDKGNELTSGVYFYRIEFTSGKKELTGYLTIKR